MGRKTPEKVRPAQTGVVQGRFNFDIPPAKQETNALPVITEGVQRRIEAMIKSGEAKNQEEAFQKIWREDHEDAIEERGQLYRR